MTNNTIKHALNNVERYGDINVYGMYHLCNTIEDFQEYINEGFIVEITPGTYNGVLDKFDRVIKLTDNDIIDAIKFELSENDFISKSLEKYYPEDNTTDMKVLDCTFVYRVFTIGERLYINIY